jgi:hypothetical protein
MQKEGQAVTPKALKKAYTIFSNLIQHPEAIRFHLVLLLISLHHYYGGFILISKPDFLQLHSGREYGLSTSPASQPLQSL